MRSASHPPLRPFAECYKYGAKRFLIALNVEKLWFREKSTLEVFDFKKIDDFSVNIKWGSADQNRLKRRTCWLLHLGFVILKLFEPHASFAIVSTCVVRRILFLLFVVFFFLKLLMRSASHSLCDPSQTATRSVKYRKWRFREKVKIGGVSLKKMR